MLKSFNLECEKKNEFSIERKDILKITIEDPSKKSTRFDQSIPEPTRLVKMQKKRSINLENSIIHSIQGAIKRFSGFLRMIRKKNIKLQPKEIEIDKKIVLTDKLVDLLKKKLQSVSVDNFRKRGRNELYETNEDSNYLG